MKIFIKILHGSLRWRIIYYLWLLQEIVSHFSKFSHFCPFMIIGYLCIIWRALAPWAKLAVSDVTQKIQE
jgi:hypothetical protein